MRQKGTAPSFQELMGSGSPDAQATDAQLGLKDLPKVLGDKMPDLPFNRVGRFRLQNALQMRFGPDYMNIPGIKNVMSEFDNHTNTQNIIKMNRGG